MTKIAFIGAGSTVFMKNLIGDALQMPALEAVGARIAYIPYGLEMGGGSWNIGAQFNQRIHQYRPSMPETVFANVTFTPGQTFIRGVPATAEPLRVKRAALRLLICATPA